MGSAQSSDIKNKKATADLASTFSSDVGSSVENNNDNNNNNNNKNWIDIASTDSGYDQDDEASSDDEDGKSSYVDDLYL